MKATIAGLDKQIRSLAQQEKEAEKQHRRACADEDKAWRVNEQAPRDPHAYADATTRRANWHSKHLRTVGKLVDQRKIRDLITAPQERQRWIADAADAIRGDVT